MGLDCLVDPVPDAGLSRAVRTDRALIKEVLQVSS